MSKSAFAVKHIKLGGRESLETAVKCQHAMQHPLRINMSPNKDNICISVTKIDSLYKFDWLIKELAEKKQETPFTIVFCNTLHDIAHLLTFFYVTGQRNRLLSI